MTSPLHRRAPRSRRRCFTAGLLLAMGLVTGCTGPGAEQASQVAVSFEQLADSDGAQACDLLSGHTRAAVEKAAKKPCADALADEDLPAASSVQSVQVYGHDAEVLLAGDVVFLARYAEGWKVTAAGCQPGTQPDEPFDCNVSGG